MMKMLIFLSGDRYLSDNTADYREILHDRIWCVSHQMRSHLSQAVGS